MGKLKDICGGPRPCGYAERRGPSTREWLASSDYHRRSEKAMIEGLPDVRL